MGELSEKTKAVLHWFGEISKIPRRSKNEEQIRAWLQNWSEEHGFSSKTDAAGNLLIDVPGSSGFADAAKVILQGHMDMVCEKTPDSDHDFTRDPIELVFDGDWLRANKTTLGADNGIAIALAMAIATDESVEHPPLELLFTVDEETGLTGANQLESGFLEGKTLLNIDSEDEGVLTIGCAGGVNVNVTLPVAFEAAPAGHTGFTLRVGGLKGGHSGVDIHEQRANAISLLVRALQDLQKTVAVKVSDIQGGSAHNAIPRDAALTLLVPDEARETIKEAVASFEKLLQGEFAGVEPGLKLSLESTQEAPKERMDEESAQKMCRLLLAMPDGVAAMATAMPGLVETSNNVATVGVKESQLQILTSLRSAVVSRLDALLARVVALAELSGGAAETSEGYPPWEPNWDSPLLARCKKVYRDTFDKEPVIEVIHAGLECGIIGAKYPGMDMISLGPTIKNPHSPDECLKLSDIDKIWKLLTALLRELSE